MNQFEILKQCVVTLARRVCEVAISSGTCHDQGLQLDNYCGPCRAMADLRRADISDERAALYHPDIARSDRIVPEVPPASPDTGVDSELAALADGIHRPAPVMIELHGPETKFEGKTFDVSIVERANASGTPLRGGEPEPWRGVSVLSLCSVAADFVGEEATVQGFTVTEGNTGSSRAGGRTHEALELMRFVHAKPGDKVEFWLEPKHGPADHNNRRPS